MNHKIYAIFDSKSEAYSLPFYYQFDGQALRTVKDWLNNPETPYAKHPEDYTLFSLGSYADDTGTITQDHITSISNLLNLKDQT
nr:MAG: nonstructural protein [Microvirus sp.]